MNIIRPKDFPSQQGIYSSDIFPIDGSSGCRTLGWIDLTSYLHYGTGLIGEITLATNSDLYSLSSTVTTLTLLNNVEFLFQLSADVQEINNHFDDVYNQLSALSSHDNRMEVEISQLSSADVSIRSNISSLSSSISTINSNISYLSAYDVTLNSNINFLSAYSSNLNNNLNSLSSSTNNSLQFLSSHDIGMEVEISQLSSEDIIIRSNISSLSSDTIPYITTIGTNYTPSHSYEIISLSANTFTVTLTTAKTLIIFNNSSGENYLSGSINGSIDSYSIYPNEVFNLKQISTNQYILI